MSDTGVSKADSEDDGSELTEDDDDTSTVATPSTQDSTSDDHESSSESDASSDDTDTGTESGGDSSQGCERNEDCTDPAATICDIASGICLKCGAKGTTQGCEAEPGTPVCNDVHECVAFPREVMSWVAAYNIKESKATLEASFGAHQAKDGLTHIGLQFWLPTKTGGLTTDGVNEDDIRWFVDWGRANNVKILLTIFNAVGNRWDWDLARAAFGPEHRAAFVQSLVAEVEKYGLDGVDLDLEGNNLKPDDGRADFKALVIDLSAALDAGEKDGVLTVCTFNNYDNDNMPDQTWYPDWVGLVDYIHVMGYGEMYENAQDKTQSYSAQQDLGAAAGHLRAQISMGLPSSTQWGDGPALQHLTECVTAPKEIASICIWELSLDSFWSNEAHWEKMIEIKSTSLRRP